jgi:hypothetical protein
MCSEQRRFDKVPIPYLCQLLSVKKISGAYETGYRSHSLESPDPAEDQNPKHLVPELNAVYELKT